LSSKRHQIKQKNTTPLVAK